MFKKGDRVTYFKVHHNHNPILKSHLGERGTINSVFASVTGRRYLVQFDRSDRGYGRWWIKEKYLK